MTTDNVNNQRMTCRRNRQKTSVHIFLDDRHKNILDQIRAVLGSITGKTPSHTLIFRRALDIYAADLSGMDDDDLVAEKLRLQAVG